MVVNFGILIGFLAILILALGSQDALPQQNTGFTFFGDRLADVTFERIGFRMTTLGGRPGMMIVGDLAGIAPPEVVQVTILAQTKNVVCRRVVKVEFDSFSAWCPNLTVGVVGGIFVEEP